MIKGTFVNFDIGNACNLRCKFCYNDGRRNIRTYFEDFDVLKKRAKDLREKTDCINLIGGEPLMYPKIIELLDYLKLLDFKISIVTNGLGFVKEDFFENIFKNENLVKITMSIHSITDENNYNIAQRKNIEGKRRIAFDKLLVLYNSGRINLSVTTVINKYNYDEIIDLFLYYKSLGVTSFGFTGMILQKDGSDSNREVTIDFQKYISKLKELNSLIKNEKVLVHWLPLCTHFQVANKLNYTVRELNDRFFKALKNNGKNLLKSHLENKKIIDKCKNCSAFMTFCNGIDKVYNEEFGDIGVKSINKQDLLLFVKNNYKKSG